MGRFLDGLQPWTLLLLRLTLGVAMLYNGWDKVIPAGGLHGNNTFSALQHWDASVMRMGLPAWLGTVSALTEFFGGMLLLVGLLTRLAAVFVAVNMGVALWKVNLHHGYTGSQYSVALFVMALVLVAFGSGALAVDRRLGLS